MSRSSGSTVRESVYALSLVAVEGEGRKAILAHSGSIQQLLQQLSSSDSAAVRYAALALGNLAMDADGRRAILQVSWMKLTARELQQRPVTDDYCCAGAASVESSHQASDVARL
jgi:hypothetical protein